MSNLPKRFEDRKVVVTGATDGMGRAVAALFASEGADILAVGRNAAKLQSLKDAHPDIPTVVQDLSDNDAPGNIVETAARVLGGIDIIVNCAGAFDMAPISDIRREHLDKMLAVNFCAPAMLCVLAVPLLRRSDAGRIINIGSIATRYTDSAMAGYAASKHALAGFTLNLALELGPLGITANLIAPGMVRTGMTEQLLEDDEVRHFFTSRIPVGRVGRADEIADAVAYLASDRAGFCNGAVIRLDGGYAIGAHNSNWAP